MRYVTVLKKWMPFVVSVKLRVNNLAKKSAIKIINEELIKAFDY